MSNPRSRIAFAVLLALVVGCGPSKHSESPAVGEHAASAATPTGPKVGMVTDTGGIDDQSFNAGAWAGLQKAATELNLPKPRYLESKEVADYNGNLSTLAEDGCSLVIAVGYMMQDALKQVAPKYPNVKFAIIDGDAPTDSSGAPLPNCEGLKFREEEGSFLAGYLAAKVSKTGTIAFVGGVEGPLLKKFEMGYYAGAQTANRNVHMIPKYVGSWTDNTKGQEIAESLMEPSSNADVLFAAAGKSGLGVIDAVKEKGAGYYAIGVDKDQDGVAPGRVLTSMMKGVDATVYETVKDLKAGKWTAGDHEFGIADGAIHLSPMKYTKQDVPPAVLAKLDDLSKQIASGAIKPPSDLAQMEAFVPPKP